LNFLECFQSAADELATVVLSSYTATLQPPQPVTNTARLKLDVVEPNGKQNKQVNLLHVGEIATCNNEAPVQG
jgi:hypothetical protein